MEPTLISGFCSYKRMSLWLPLDGTLIHRRLAPSSRWYSFTYPERMESWVSLGEKEGHTNIQISAEPGSNHAEIFCLEGSDLTNCINHARPAMMAIVVFHGTVEDDYVNDGHSHVRIPLVVVIVSMMKQMIMSVILKIILVMMVLIMIIRYNCPTFNRFGLCTRGESCPLPSEVVKSVFVCSSSSLTLSKSSTFGSFLIAHWFSCAFSNSMTWASCDEVFISTSISLSLLLDL